jgi:hypothetical protein
LRILLLALQVRDRGNASGGNRGGTCFKKIATGKLSFIGVLRQGAPPACRIDTGFLRKGELTRREMPRDSEQEFIRFSGGQGKREKRRQRSHAYN